MDKNTDDKTKVELLQDLVDFENQLIRLQEINGDLSLFKDNMIKVFGLKTYKAGVQGMGIKVERLKRRVKNLRERIGGM